MGIVLCINDGSEVMVVNDKGEIGRLRDGRFFVVPSPSWRIVGAVEFNNFGSVVGRYPLEAVLHTPGGIPWKWKNGKQRVFIRDCDHGTIRQWTRSCVAYPPSADYAKQLDEQLARLATLPVELRNRT